MHPSGAGNLRCWDVEEIVGKGCARGDALDPDSRVDDGIRAHLIAIAVKQDSLAQDAESVGPDVDVRTRNDPFPALPVAGDSVPS